MKDPQPQGREQRTRKRRAVALWATATGTGSSLSVRCMIRDAHKSDCRIVTSRIDELPDRISLQIDGLAKPVGGRIAWRMGRAAGIEFL